MIANSRGLHIMILLAPVTALCGVLSRPVGEHVSACAVHCLCCSVCACACVRPRVFVVHRLSEYYIAS